MNFSSSFLNHSPVFSLHLYQSPPGFLFLSKWIHHSQNAADHIINFLFLSPSCLPTWQNPENPVSVKWGRLLPTLNSSHQSQRGTQQRLDIMLSFSIILSSSPPELVQTLWNWRDKACVRYRCGVIGIQVVSEATGCNCPGRIWGVGRKWAQGGTLNNTNIGIDVQKKKALTCKRNWQEMAKTGEENQRKSGNGFVKQTDYSKKERTMKMSNVIDRTHKCYRLTLQVKRQRCHRGWWRGSFSGKVGRCQISSGWSLRRV